MRRVIFILKYIGTTALCLSLSAVGLYILFFYRKRYELLKILSEFFSEISSVSMLSRSELVFLIKRLGESKRFGCLSFIDTFVNKYEDGCDLRALWDKSVKESGEFLYLDKNSKEQLLYFAEVFGKSGMDEFSRKCIKYSEIFSDSAQKEEDARQKNASLYMGMSVFAAAAVFIIFI